MRKTITSEITEHGVPDLYTMVVDRGEVEIEVWVTTETSNEPVAGWVLPMVGWEVSREETNHRKIVPIVVVPECDNVASIEALAYKWRVQYKTDNDTTVKISYKIKPINTSPPFTTLKDGRITI